MASETLDVAMTRLLVSIATGDNAAAAIQACKQLIKCGVNLEEFLLSETDINTKP